MKHAIDYANLPPEQKANKALADTQSYLGDRFDHIIALLTEEIELGHFKTRKQIHFAMSFVGVQGYPVAVLIDKYWPTLPADMAGR
jgi:hypothetical protein